jgi:FKBP-type peptidyl-prolyl cis-trans isomerase
LVNVPAYSRANDLENDRTIELWTTLDMFHTTRTVLVEGDGRTFPSPGDTLTMHYTGFLKTGQRFDSSYDRNTTFTFVIGRGDVIKGWEEAVPHVGVPRNA